MTTTFTDEQIEELLAEAAQAELDRRAAESVRVAVTHPSFDQLCERRGETERAEAQRRLLAERGIV